jgi:DNA-binding transcriptional ArsR family regulator
MDDALKLQIFLQTLGEANRLRIIKFIGKEERSVSEIVQEIGLSQPLVSHHLRILRRGQVLETKREGPFVFYALRNIKLLDALGMISEIVRTLDEKVVDRPMFCCPPWWLHHSRRQ